MKARQLFIVLVLLVAVGGAALFLSRRNAGTWSSSAITNARIVDFPLNDVARVSIRSGGEEVSLVKKEELWRVQERADFPADFEKVSALIRKVWELKPVQDVKVGPSQLERLQLTEPSAEANSGTRLEFKAAGDNSLVALLLGKKLLRSSEPGLGRPSEFPVGRYVMPAGQAQRVFLVADTFEDAPAKPEQWLRRDFIKIENPKLISVASPELAINWTLVRENASAAWKLTDAKPDEEIDPAKAASAASAFAYGNFNDVLPPDAEPAVTGLDTPASVRFETVDGFTYELRIGKVSADNYPVLVSVTANLPKERPPAPDEKPEDKVRLDQEFQAKQKQLADKLTLEQQLPQRPYLIAKATVDQLVKGRVAFLIEKKPSPVPAAPTASPGSAKPVPSPKGLPKP